MAKKITLQHWYTTGSTTAPTGLIEGEIAISHATGSEAIFLKNDKNNNEVKFIPKTQIENLINAATTGLASDDRISALTTDLNSHKNLKGSENKGSTPTFGHVSLVSGDISGITGYIDGFAASSYHTHGQYLTGVTPGSGQPIVSIIEDGVAKIGLTTGITNQINSGVTAYGWGNHANAGYAQKKDLTAHTNNGDIHVTKSQKDAWDKAKSDIDAFFNDNATISGAVDTLKEIQDFLTSDNGTVQTLLDNLSALTDTVSGNTDSISGLNTDVKMLKDESANYIKELIGDDHIKAEKLPGVLQQWALTHMSASTQNSAITATNDTTGLSFGSEFKIVDNIGYDKNGHVVSGSTQTLKLPTLALASTLAVGVSMLKDGDLSDITDIKNGEAAASYHYHGQYVKFTDLYSGNTSSNITISCGTY